MYQGSISFILHPLGTLDLYLYCIHHRRIYVYMFLFSYLTPHSSMNNGVCVNHFLVGGFFETAYDQYFHK